MSGRATTGAGDPAATRRGGATAAGRQLVRRGPLLAWLVIVWVALWGDVSLANVLSGLVVAVGVTVLAPLPRAGRTTVARPLAAGRFLLVLIGELVVASLAVARLTLLPAGRRRTDIIAFRVADTSPVVVTLVANAISLTPGTLTLDVAGSTLYVHVLHADDLDAALAGMRRLAAAVVAAFGSCPPGPPGPSGPSGASGASGSRR